MESLVETTVLQNPAERRALSRESCGLVGRSEVLCHVTRLLGKVAATDSTVLILGESGTGKEVVAQCLHQHSARAAGSFVAINCGAIPPELMESELFGHEKGAFTGALLTRKGRFELAEGGTLFLDEVAEMTPPMQVKLLRVLQEHQYERVGGSKPRDADVRIIAATHRDLEARIRDGLFREDLYYRLNVFPVELPPLRQRGDDLFLLLEHFLAQRQEDGFAPFSVSAEVKQILLEHCWPGNVRELRNLVERLSILRAGEEVQLSDLPGYIWQNGKNAEAESDALRTVWAEEPEESLPVAELAEEVHCLPDGPFDLKNYLEEIERNLILQALDLCDQVVARAAERLGLRRTTLVEKLRKYAIQPGRE
ncbi:sigma-54-dependent Fis family transcriptional regulator [Acidithiobacillus sp. CV18-2]|uniref:Sigma-54-dependent Fis family transcriptional regulator n=1 Tax=Igneacidithiobacillus copahuensis TaxID=2724909 RepID=A0AAE2YND1_9PROT|nr:sigma-54 dependent transcriptional regulator [Igneacidithiobacillus copahuensis]MBU2754392.1 sigma-54-dependent Fis family transcriptional regulator [Acidithiobacillus sp. CV18-3]MBU2757585.1 sigma-54-dependent Fis family transcriptional regulator [Acidithiobacillus sp. BN09-2]MBU2777100.1 sigma-54-dependent Fis family transcriptional regulator [Acidithiobacillus sp. CV18-2]MBU2797413.1 sigma-54-dependent Fis family transcriptional regulator [Acidithiobacillus sp. VAN18-2]MBU2799749.1 sigma